MGRDRTKEFVLLGILLAIVPIGVSLLAACIRKRRRVEQKRRRDALAGVGHDGVKRGEVGREVAGGLGEEEEDTRR